MRLSKSLLPPVLFISAALLFWPPHTGVGQSGRWPKDSLALKVDRIVERVDKAEKRADSLKLIVDQTTHKPDEIKFLVDRLLKKKTKIRKVVVTKKEPAPYPVPVVVTRIIAPDDSITVINGRTIIYRTAYQKYGGDTFRTNMWKAPGSDGIIKGIGQSKLLKKIFKKQ